FVEQALGVPGQDPGALGNAVVSDPRDGHLLALHVADVDDVAHRSGDGAGAALEGDRPLPLERAVRGEIERPRDGAVGAVELDRSVAGVGDREVGAGAAPDARHQPAARAGAVRLLGHARDLPHAVVAVGVPVAAAHGLVVLVAAAGDLLAGAAGVRDVAGPRRLIAEEAVVALERSDPAAHRPHTALASALVPELHAR